MTQWPVRGWIGLLLVAVFWALNWSLDGLRTSWAFFPLWLGYCLAIDAAVFVRTGSSLWTRSRGRYVGLFLVSAPAWWLFEVINWRTANWQYQGRTEFTELEYFLLASLSFSTVIPAVFGTAELMSSLPWLRRMLPRARFGVTPFLRIASVGCGLATLGLVLVWPLYFFPFVWVSLLLIMDPLNDALGYRSLVSEISKGDWRSPVALAAGCLVCGFFWEMWNYYSFPKWTYYVPFVDYVRVFEMPLLGYGGYIPFSMELFALYHCVTGLLLGSRAGTYVKLR